MYLLLYLLSYCNNIVVDFREDDHHGHAHDSGHAHHDSGHAHHDNNLDHNHFSASSISDVSYSNYYQLSNRSQSYQPIDSHDRCFVVHEECGHAEDNHNVVDQSSKTGFYLI